MVTEQGIVHYEAYGRGRPVILLHGWLGSWALWRETIEDLGKEFRTYALDFFGFGESFDRTANFSVDNFVELVHQFMERQGIHKAAIVGHSMGGTVALGVSLKYPEKVVKTVVIGSPIDGKSLNPFLKLSGYRGIANLVYTFPIIRDAFILLMTRIGSKKGGDVHRMVREDASKVSAESFFESIGTLRDTDLREQIRQIQIPILGMYGRTDIIVSPKQSKVLLEYAPNSQEEWFDKAGHFPMIDDPQHFHDTLRKFLHGD